MILTNSCMTDKKLMAVHPGSGTGRFREVPIHAPDSGLFPQCRLCPGIFLDFFAIFPYNPNRIWYCHRVVSESACLHIVRSWKMCRWGLVFCVWRVYEETDSVFFERRTGLVERFRGKKRKSFIPLNLRES